MYAQNGKTYRVQQYRDSDNRCRALPEKPVCFRNEVFYKGSTACKLRAMLLRQSVHAVRFDVTATFWLPAQKQQA